MKNWREEILKYFVSGIARKTVVADPDELFRDKGLYTEISRRGFSLLHFEDSVSFRFTYESEFREAWDNGEKKELVVIVKPDNTEFDMLPADLLQNAKKLTFYLKDIFQNLSYNAIAKLDKSYFDPLYQAYNKYVNQVMGQSLTIEFILKHVFGIVPEVIKKKSDLLRMLLKRHYNKLSIPGILDQHLLTVIENTGIFEDWPLNYILSDRTAFWDFLQERWQIFVAGRSGAKTNMIADKKDLKYHGETDIPFDHDDLRGHIEKLFEEGILLPIEENLKASLSIPWVKVGLKGKTPDQIKSQFQDILTSLQNDIPGLGVASHLDWFKFAMRYAQFRYMWFQNIHDLKADHTEDFNQISDTVNICFQTWSSENFQGLYNYPSANPVMVHHIPGYLAHKLTEPGVSRIAFILIDGLALDQWLLLKNVLIKNIERISIRDNTLMAWIPTITPVSRQAAFSGKIPRYFTDTIYRTDKDEYLWRQFWSDRNFRPDEISFLKINGDSGNEDKLDNVIGYQTRALGCTIYKVDQIMHGVQVGNVGMWNQIKIWSEQNFFSSFIKKLLSEKFYICISSDHGNIEAKGIGSTNDGVLCDNKGERCRIYSDLKLRNEQHKQFQKALCWDHQGLPKDYYCLLSPQGKSFGQKDKTVVCHGGISIDEVMVPFIEISYQRASYGHDR
jgi:hypothetical protein